MVQVPTQSSQPGTSRARILIFSHARSGVRHRLTTILAVALACAGARSLTAIAEWAHDAPTEALGRFGIEGLRPSESTIRRTLARVDAPR
ncbi:transposase family protein [Nocardia xishanensis]